MVKKTNDHSKGSDLKNYYILIGGDRSKLNGENLIGHIP